MNRCAVHEGGFDRNCDACFMSLLVAEELARKLVRAIVVEVYGNYYEHPPYTDLERELEAEPEKAVREVLEGVRKGTAEG